MESDGARLLLRKALRGKILRLMNHQHHPQITREEVEAVGSRAKMRPDEASREFLRLQGLVWSGTISRSSESEHSWDTAHLDVPWFQRRGDVPIPWDN